MDWASQRMSVLLSVGPKCTLSALHAGPLMSHGKYADGTARLTDIRQTVTLRFLLRRGQRNKAYTLLYFELCHRHTWRVYFSVN